MEAYVVMAQAWKCVDKIATEWAHKEDWMRVRIRKSTFDDKYPSSLDKRLSGACGIRLCKLNESQIVGVSVKGVACDRSMDTRVL